MRRSVMIGTGSCIPERRVPNDEFLNNRFFMDYGDPIDTAVNDKTISKFQDITDISERRYAEDDQVASDLGAIAAEKAIESAGIDKESLDYIIFAHNFGDVLADNRHIDTCPSLAARVKQERIGLPSRSTVQAPQ